MTLESLKNNINEQREILREIYAFTVQMEVSEGQERDMLFKTINALTELFRIINNSIPLIAESISPIKKLGQEKEVKGLVKLSYEKGGKRVYITVEEKDKGKFIKQLSLSLNTLNRLKKSAKTEEVAFKDFKKPSGYAKFANKFFSKYSNKLIEKGNFKRLALDLRKANLPFILNTYVSMLLLTTVISFIAGIFIYIFFIFFSIGIDFPFFKLVDFSLIRIFRNLLIILVVPALGFIGFYFYPYTERESIGRKIERELPFVTIHMSAIAGSGIEPSQIFKIIATGKEYPATRQELRKVINQVNVYGYDLVNSLRNSARATPSSKMAELFNGFATTISSGGSLPEFLDKRSETLLFDYRLDREKATRTAETFMDIYISIVIAAPMIMMLLLILISVSRISIGLSIQALTAIILGVVALINIVFLAFLQLEQTGY